MCVCVCLLILPPLPRSHPHSTSLGINASDSPENSRPINGRPAPASIPHIWECVRRIAAATALVGVGAGGVAALE